jgi:alkanesulfonate monooxygenase SsuD/methylene tetrahydromethanopterin reductase-like flavin-dependent oxidoreductase (luciferase family)
MQFSVLFEMQLADPSRANEAQLMRDCVDQAVWAEEMEFDRVWAVEHHALTWFAHMSAPEIFLTWVAARTSTIRVGHAVVCVPFAYNHPIRVAERVATLDILSGGRVDLGVGRGATFQEMGAFNIAMEDTLDQMVEAISMIPKMWRDEDFEWHGKLLDVPPRPIIPKPMQTPHPPLYMACSREDTLRLAAELGLGALAMGWGGPEDTMVKRKIYDEAIAARDLSTIVGEAPVNHLSGLVPACVLPDRDQARKIGLRGQRFFTDAIGHWYSDGPPPRADTEGEDHVAAMEEHSEQVMAFIREHAGELPGQDLVKGGKVARQAEAQFDPNQCYGNVDDAIAYCQRQQDAGADELMFVFQMGTIPHEVAMKGIELVGKHVIPAFR